MATYGANDALYGTGTFGTARYGRVTPIIAVSGVVGTSAVGTVTPKAEVSLTATGVSATGSVGEVEEQPTGDNNALKNFGLMALTMLLLL